MRDAKAAGATLFPPWPATDAFDRREPIAYLIDISNISPTDQGMGGFP
jgi:hypothetical protein